MHRSTYLVDAYYNRDIRLHKPGVIPKWARHRSAITTNRHKYELKQELTTNKTVEAWFENHSPEERRTVYSFLDTISKSNNANQQKVVNSRLYNRVRTAPANSTKRRLSESTNRGSQASQRDVDQLAGSLEKVHLPALNQEKTTQTLPSDLTVQPADVHETTNTVKNEIKAERPSTTTNNDIDNKRGRRYLTHTWRTINPQEDVQLNPRSEHNASSFFNYTKKTYPEYFFIHPDWY